METIFITGGAGFIGSNFIRYWRNSHPADRIINYDLLTYAGNQASLDGIATSSSDRERYCFVEGDIGNYHLLTHLFAMYRPKYIINFAAESHNSRAITDPRKFFSTNVMGTQCLLDAARDTDMRRLHHISTCEVYGDLSLDSDERFSELSPYRPKTPYNASKAAADLLVRAYYETFKIPVTISNCCNNYGPYQFPEKVIPLFITRALRGQKLPLYQHSRNRREWLHVLDHCKAIELILERGQIGQTYNVGSGVEVDVEFIAEFILKTLDKGLDLKSYVKDRPSHDRRYLLNSQKICRELGWSPQHALDEGLRETITWYESHPEWWEPLMSKLEIREDEW